MKNFLFGKAGTYCRRLAMIVCYAGVGLSLLFGILTMCSSSVFTAVLGYGYYGGYGYGYGYGAPSFGGVFVILGLLVIVVGSVLSWLGSLQLYAIGEMAEKSQIAYDEAVALRNRVNGAAPKPAPAPMPKPINMWDEPPRPAPMPKAVDMWDEPPRPAPAPAPKNDIVDPQAEQDERALSQLDALVNAGILSPQEYEQKRAQIEGAAAERMAKLMPPEPDPMDEQDERALSQLDALLNAGILSPQEVEMKRAQILEAAQQRKAQRRPTPAPIVPEPVVEPAPFVPEPVVEPAPFVPEPPRPVFEGVSTTPAMDNTRKFENVAHESTGTLRTDEVSEDESAQGSGTVAFDGVPLHITLTTPDGNTQQLQYDISSELYIGRIPGNDIIIDDRSVSGRHMRLALVDGRLTATDLNSTNGSALNGERMLAGQVYELQSGVTLFIAHSRMQITFVL